MPILPTKRPKPHPLRLPACAWYIRFQVSRSNIQPCSSYAFLQGKVIAVAELVPGGVSSRVGATSRGVCLSDCTSVLQAGVGG